jgi:3-hydroxybutyryl-CoA dehydratase
MAHGLWFEEFRVGQEFETGSRVIDDAAIAAFAAVSGDDNPLHLDEAHARDGAFGGRVAHGLLGPAVLSGLVGALGLSRGTLVALVGVEFEFMRPIRPGTAVRARIRVDRTRPTSAPGRGLVVFAVELVDSEGQLLQRGELRELIRSRP